ncbi:MAG: hypothetical protein U9Q82_03395 [Chloroflexota bacterium]|nr:hypothetical protein [Chloroflexota bacterium]
MVAIKEGIELNRAIAQAIGKHIIAGLVSVPRYSTDLNAAFDAAEKVGLFALHQHNGVLRQANALEPPGLWEFAWDGLEGRPTCKYVLGSTPALAVCAAILKLTKE